MTSHDGRYFCRMNGYREREWDTRVGTIDLPVPKLRVGCYFLTCSAAIKAHIRARQGPMRAQWTTRKSSRSRP